MNSDIDYRLAFDLAPIGLVLSRNRAIIDCIQHRDADGAEQAMRAHVRRSRQTLLRHLRGVGVG